MTHMPTALHRNHRPTVGTRARTQFSPPTSVPRRHPRAPGRKELGSGPPRRVTINRRNQISSIRAQSRLRLRRNEHVIDGIIDGENFSGRRFNRQRRRRTMTRPWRRTSPDLPAHSPAGVTGGGLKGRGLRRREREGRDERRRRRYFWAASTDFRATIKQCRWSSLLLSSIVSCGNRTLTHWLMARSTSVAMTTLVLHSRVTSHS